MSKIEIFYCLLAYFVAAIPFGVIVSRLVVGKDVRQQGSGNIGATNVARLMGKKWGILVLLLDALKGFAVVFGSGWIPTTHFASLEFANLVALVAVIGHCYPLYLKFKGGKGVATALGVIAALSPLMVGVCLGTFLVAVAISRRISVGSLAAALVVPVVAAVMKTPLSVIPMFLISALIWWKHAENVKRIFQGKEPRFF